MSCASLVAGALKFLGALHGLLVFEQVITAIFVNDLELKFQLPVLILLVVEGFLFDLSDVVQKLLLPTIIFNTLGNIVQVAIGIYVYSTTTELSVLLFGLFLGLQVAEIAQRLTTFYFCKRNREEYEEETEKELSTELKKYYDGLKVYVLITQLIIGLLFLVGNAYQVKRFSDIFFDIMCIVAVNVANMMINASMAVGRKVYMCGCFYFDGPKEEIYGDPLKKVVLYVFLINMVYFSAEMGLLTTAVFGGISNDPHEKGMQISVLLLWIFHVLFALLGLCVTLTCFDD